jgi:hypothetical protein
MCRRRTFGAGSRERLLSAITAAGEKDGKYND